MKYSTNISKQLTAVIACLLALSLSSCHFSKTKKREVSAIQVDSAHTYTDTSASFVKVYNNKGQICIQQSNTFYQLMNAYDGDTLTPLLLKINKVELCVADSVNKEKVFTIEANSILDHKDIHWSAHFVATDIAFNDNTLIATMEGTGNEEDFITRYNLITGQKVFSCSYSDLKISIPNVRTKRFIGYTSRDAATSPVQNLHEENLIALIEYSSSDGSIDLLHLKLKRSAIAQRIPAYSPEMILVPANENSSAIEDGKALILMHADEHYQPSDVKDFSVQYTFYFGDDNEATKVIIPIANDHLDVVHAQYDHDIFELSK